MAASSVDFSQFSYSEGFSCSKSSILERYFGLTGRFLVSPFSRHRVLISFNGKDNFAGLYI